MEQCINQILLPLINPWLRVGSAGSVPDGFRVGSRWALDRFRVGSGSAPGGLQVSSGSVPGGFRVVS
jgi:hypothetical protein